MLGLADNPFTPGAGLTPAYMGRRPKVERALLRLLGAVRNNSSGAHAALLFGPRGNGKTVLLNWFERQAHGTDDGQPIAVVRFSSRDLADARRMNEAIEKAASQWASGWQRLGRIFAGASIAVPPLTVRVSDRGERLGAAWQTWLEKGKGPLVLTVDEAHVSQPLALGDFLDAIQIAGRSRPLLVVLAGTPGVITTLLDSRSSFWSRFTTLRIGLLDDDAARTVLSEPFRMAGISAAGDATATLAEAADNYPYFLQLHGEAAWDAVADTGMTGLGMEHVPTAIETADAQRKMYYSHRHAEFRRCNRMPLARDVALAFRSSRDGTLATGDLTRLLERHGDSAAELEDFLAANGYIWQNEDGSAWSPGIPSLMSYMVELTEA